MLSDLELERKKVAAPRKHREMLVKRTEIEQGVGLNPLPFSL